ncbi:MAG: hypothetical protein ACYCVZ_03845 [Streptosporangiaceae bacterium]
MDALTTIGWLLAAVPVTFWIVWRRAAAEIRRVRDEERARTAEWQARAERFRLTAIRLKLEIDAYRAGHAQGRDDGLRAIRAVAAVARDTGTPAAPAGSPSAQGD